jgi:hypothetical protein
MDKFVTTANIKHYREFVSANALILHKHGFAAGVATNQGLSFSTAQRGH